MTTDHQSLVDEQRSRWSDDDRVSVEELLRSNSQEAGNTDLVLDLIYSEILLREDRGESPVEEDYHTRFPNLRPRVDRQFQVHRALQQTEPAAPAATPSLIGSDTEAVTRVPVIDGFEFHEIVGEGGHGIAYRAYDTKLKRIVAIKLLRGIDATDATRRRVLRHEAEAAAALVHPSIVAIHEVGEIDRSPYLVMDFLSGGSLAERLQDGPFSVDDAVQLLVKIAQAVSYAHRQEIIHRDLKPGNILLDDAGEPFITDFGLARRMDASQTVHATGDVIGTPAYMPPEQARGERANEQSDLYSLGVILYEVLCGHPPFQAATPWDVLHQVLTSDPPSLRQLNRSLPKDLETICEVCLSKTPSRRFDSVDTFVEELQRFQNGQPIESRPAGRVRKTFAWCQRNPVVAVLSGLVALALIATAVVALVSQRRISTALERTEIALGDAKNQRDVAFNAVSDKVYDDLTKREASVEARKEVLQSAIAGLQRIIDAGAANREDIVLTMSTARSRFGYILAQQGKNSEAEQQFLQSISLAESFASAGARRIAARQYSHLALQYSRVADGPSVKQAATKSNELVAVLVTEFPSEADLRLRQAVNHSYLATAAQMAGDVRKWLDLLRLSRQQLGDLYQSLPEEKSIRDELVNVDLSLAAACLQQGMQTEAGECLGEAIPIIERDNPESSDDVHPRIRYYTAVSQLAQIEFAATDYSQALNRINVAIAGYEGIIAAEPNRPGFRLKIAGMFNIRARCFLATGQTDSAIVDVDRQIDEFRNGLELGGPAYEPQKYAIVIGLLQRVDLHVRQNDLMSALADARLAATTLQPLVEKYKEQAFYDVINDLADLIAAWLGEESSADQPDVRSTRLALDAWTAAKNGDLSVFTENEQQIKHAMATASESVVRGILATLYVQTLGLQYESLVENSSVSEKRIAESEAELVETIRMVQSIPGGDPMIHVAAPEFSAFRKTERFRQEFPLQ